MNQPSPISRRSLLRSTGLLGIAALPVSSVLSACATASGGGSTGAKGAVGKASTDNPLGVSADAPLDVVVFKGGYGDQYAVFDEGLYTQRFPKASVKHSAITDVKGQLQPRFVGGNPPDVVDSSGSGAITVATLVQQGQAANLSDLLAAPSQDDPAKKVADTVLPGAFDAVTFDGKVYAVPYVYTVRGFWYSASLFAKHGWTWPDTWDGLMALAGQMKAAGLSPFTYGGQTAPDYFGYVLFSLAYKRAGLQVIKDIDNLKPGAWKADAMQAAAGALQQIADKGYFLSGSAGLTHTQAQTSWVQGQVGAYSSGSWIENEMKGIAPADFQMTFGAVPLLAKSDPGPLTALAASSAENYLVPAKAANARGGMEYLRIMLSKQAAAKFTELTRTPTIVAGATGGQSYGSTALASLDKAISDAGSDVFNWRFTGWYPDLNKTFKTELGNLLAGRSDAAKFLNAMQSKSDAVSGDSSVQKYTR